MIAHLSRMLTETPTIVQLPGVAVRAFAGEDDIDRWLELRTKAFADQTPAVRSWTRADFVAEFLSKPWWSPERTWFAEADGTIGSVTFAMRGSSPDTLPVIHWLMVAPGWRRRGVGALLIRTLEAACWQSGHRQIGLQTHAGWTEAAEFYQAMGYRYYNGSPSPQTPAAR